MKGFDKMKEISEVRKWLKAEDKANLMLYKAMGKMYSRLANKFMWDLKVIDKMYFEVDPWNGELTIYTHSTNHAPDSEFVTHNGSIGKWHISVRVYKDFLDIRPSFIQEVVQWGFNNVIRHFDYETNPLHR